MQKARRPCRRGTSLRIENVIWLEAIVEKLAYKHHVLVDEVVEVLENEPQFRFVEKGHRDGEDLYAALGQSESGRYLTVIFVHKPARQALIVSARDMSQAERRLYERH
jgi:uncharacterized DUF497 family protein